LSLHPAGAPELGGKFLYHRDDQGPVLRRETRVGEAREGHEPMDPRATPDVEGAQRGRMVRSPPQVIRNRLSDRVAQGEERAYDVPNPLVRACPIFPEVSPMPLSDHASVVFIHIEEGGILQDFIDEATEVRRLRRHE